MKFKNVKINEINFDRKYINFDVTYKLEVFNKNLLFYFFRSAMSDEEKIFRSEIIQISLDEFNFILNKISKYKNFV